MRVSEVSLLLRGLANCGQGIASRLPFLRRAKSARKHMLSLATRLLHPQFPRFLPALTRTYAADPRHVPNDKWNYNKSPLFDPTPVDISVFPVVNANELEAGLKPPRAVKMLVRDYIEDSLYNPNYGYFSKQATIFGSKAKPFDFSSLRDSAEFSTQVAEKYAEYGHNTQLWHTPTELFRVTIFQAIRRCYISYPS